MNRKRVISMPEKVCEHIIETLIQQSHCNERVARFATMTDESLRTIYKTLKRQKRFNNQVVLFSIACSAYIYYNEKRIDNLRKQVKELKQTKGE
jgi:tRNA isopentenyl-2-thiomethyl-A-37 hydroxylase MiaE